MRGLHTLRRCVLRSKLRLHSKRSYQTTPRAGDTVFIAMSGGVDSSVSAALLANQDYNLRAVFMRNWDTRDENASDTGCEWELDWDDVQRVCRVLDIPCQMASAHRPTACDCRILRHLPGRPVSRILESSI
jgi:asparagine synthetase B (glutamine-hydrolysing)